MTQRPLRSYDVRERNEKLVLQLIQRADGISQSEVSQSTGLKPPTVFRIFSQLESEGLIRECSAERRTAGTKGRKPVFYCVVPESFYTIGVDFWAGSAAVVVLDFAGTTVHSRVVDTAVDVDAEEVMKALSSLINDAVSAGGLEPERVLGVGVGAPGIVDIRTGHVLRYPRIRGMNDYPVKDRLEEDIGRPVHVHNNTAVLTLGEYRYGLATGQQSVLSVLIRSGVGGAFLQDGHILTNRGRTVLELGHMVLDPGGPPCESGLGGCLESYLSEAAIGEALRSAGYGDLEEAERRFEAEGYARLEASTSQRRALLSQLVGSSRQLQDIALRFSQAIHSLSNLLNPECYLIVSRYRWLSQFLSTALDEYLDADSPGLSEGAAEIVPQKYDPIRACRGAADLVLDSFFARE